MAAGLGDDEPRFDGARLLRSVPAVLAQEEQCAQTDDSLLTAYMRALTASTCTSTEAQTDDCIIEHVGDDRSIQTDHINEDTQAQLRTTATQTHHAATRGVGAQATPPTTRLRSASTQTTAKPPPRPHSEHLTHATPRAAASATGTLRYPDRLPELLALRRDTELELLWTQQAIESRREVGTMFCMAPSLLTGSVCVVSTHQGKPGRHQVGPRMHVLMNTRDADDR